MGLRVGVPAMVCRGLRSCRDVWCHVGAWWHWGAEAVVGVHPGQAAHTYWGRRVVLGCAQEDLENAGRHILYYRNDGIRHGAQGRAIETSCDRGASAIWHVIGTPMTGVEAAQVSKAAADKRPSRVHGVTQALRQQPPASGLATARGAYAPGDSTTLSDSGSGRTPSVERARPASDVVLYQLDLLRRAGDNCRQ